MYVSSFLVSSVKELKILILSDVLWWLKHCSPFYSSSGIIATLATQY